MNDEDRKKKEEEMLEVIENSIWESVSKLNKDTKSINIKRDLLEDNRLQTVVLHINGAYDLYRGNGDDDCMYITEHGNPNKILMVVTKELWNKIFEGESR